MDLQLCNTGRVVIVNALDARKHTVSVSNLMLSVTSIASALDARIVSLLSRIFHKMRSCLKSSQVSNDNGSVECTENK
jgi:hypothetical protein